MNGRIEKPLRSAIHATVVLDIKYWCRRRTRYTGVGRSVVERSTAGTSNRSVGELRLAESGLKGGVVAVVENVGVVEVGNVTGTGVGAQSVGRIESSGGRAGLAG